MSDVLKRLLDHFKASKPITKPNISDLKKANFVISAAQRNVVWKQYQAYIEETEGEGIGSNTTSDTTSNSDNKLNPPNKNSVSTYKVNTPFKYQGDVYKSTIEITEKAAEELGDLVTKV